MTDTLEKGNVSRLRPPKRRRSRWGSMFFVALLVSLGLVATGVLPVQQFLERENQVDDARDRLADLEAQNELLAAEADALLSQQEIERIAREQYGFVRPGEIGYVVITPDADESPIAPPDPVAVTVEESEDDRGFLQRIWDFITGRDTATDG